VASRRWAILLEEDVPVDPRKYGDLVASLLGLARLEARLLVRRGRGLFLENVPETEALRIAEELLRDGIRSRLILQDQIPPFPRPVKVTQLEGGEEALAYRTSEGIAALPWEALLVASCGLVARPGCGDFFSHVPFENFPSFRGLEDRDREIVRENLILKMTAPPPAEEPGKLPPAPVFEEIERRHGSRVRVYLDLLTADLGSWLRIPMEEVAYRHTPGQVWMGLSWGFQMLTDDLRKKCPAALTEISRKLLRGMDPRELVFPRIEEFTRYTTWVALRRRLGETGAGGPPGGIFLDGPSRPG